MADHTAARILIIDDDDALRATMRDMLEDAGFDVLDAANGARGIAVLETAPVDLVITDILMPEKEGIETIREIRQRYPDVKVIAASGGGQTGNVAFLDLAKKLGAHEVMEKPIHMDPLVDTVRKLLNAPAS